ncbi:conserved hypothetical protein [uncultured delta proteobacterium]|uniref:YhaN AAA domain-containing protein n=1 Tax=uncultured delta proteobacterium TaxID=34034 RepID=A0A212JTS7_9DELT|nr:conserved hypothetical protein [uncultured delta proteobacterium]
MRIREFSIDRFGMLASQRVPDLSPGITVFFGENEAGKSTCLNFFRAMLFGYARNRRSIDYLTDAKGVSGGSLLIDSDSLGPVRLARVPGPHGGKAALTGPDGSPRPESDLAVLLRGCTPDLFDKVFAFSLGELMQFSSLTDDNIRHALHGAAFGTGLRSPGQVLKQLDDAMRQIYAPRATSSAIHGLLRELEEVNATIRDRGNEVDRYASLRADLETATRELEASKTARAAMETERRRLERVIALRRRWEALREAEDALAAFPESSGVFTPDGRERLDRLADRLEERRHVLAQASAALQRAEEERASLAFDPALAGALGAVQSLAERKENMRAAATEIQSLNAEKDALARQAAAVCADLGPGWNAGKLETADISLAAHEKCETLGKALALAEAARQSARAEVGRLERERLAARESWEEAVVSLREAGGEGSGDGGENPVAGPPVEERSGFPDDAALERLSQLLVRAEDADEKTTALALAARNAEQALDGAVAAIDPSWSREDAERVSLTPTDRERLLGLARSAEDAASRESERERETKAAELLFDDIAERAAMLEHAVAERAARLSGTVDPAVRTGAAGRETDAPVTERLLEEAASSLDRARRTLRRAQAARKSLETARTAYDTANEQLGDIVSLMRGARPKSAFPWATAILFLAVLCLVCGGGVLYFGLAGGQEGFVRAGSGALAAGVALGAAWLALAARGGADAASEAMERNWSAIEQRLIRTRIAAQDARLEAEAVLESLPEEAPDLFPGGMPGYAIDAESLAEAEQTLARRREQYVILERDAKDLERENAALGAAKKRLDHASSALHAARARCEEARAAWEAALAASCLPAATPVTEARSLLERLDAAAACRASLRARLAEQQAAENALAECLRFARSLPELADMFASLPEPGSHLAPAPGPWLALVRDYLARERHAGRERIRLRELTAMRRARLDELTGLESRAGAALEAAESAAGEAAVAWRSWLEAHDLSPSLSPETARRALETAGKARAALDAARRIAARIEALDRETVAFCRELALLAIHAPDHPARAQLALVAGGEAPASVDPAVMASVLSFLDDLAALARSAGEKAAVVRAAEKELPVLRDGVALAKEHAAATEAEMAEMLRLAGCDTLERYRGAHAVWEQREGALAAKRTISAALEREAAEHGIALEETLASFAATGPEDTADALAAREADLGEALAREHALAERKGGLEAEMAGLMNEKGLTELLARRESLTNDMQSAAREWSRLAVAREMLLHAKGRFESERQGGVVRYAGEIFSAITEGAYSGITVSLADESVAAVARDGSVKNPEAELSRGTREQLYLALRLAYVLDHGAQAEKLPVVMDDILVNFDDKRARHTASVLASFAEKHQVLFFTCHEKTAAMLADAAPETVGYVLRKGNFVRA